jgi:hypothetical protein
MLAGGINVVTVSLMVTVFTMTGGLTGVEVGIAGGSAALLQTILEAYFGERTVRSLAEQARAALEHLADESLLDVVAPVSASLDRASTRFSSTSWRRPWRAPGRCWHEASDEPCGVGGPAAR